MLATSTEVVDWMLHCLPSDSDIRRRGEALADAFVVVGEPHLVPAGGDLAEEGRDLLGVGRCHVGIVSCRSRVTESRRVGMSKKTHSPEAAVRAATTAMAPP
jgi:hypothetical protein